MKKIVLLMLFISVLFTGCYNKQSDIRTITLESTKVVLPADTYTSHYSVARLDPSLTRKSKDKVIDELIKYSVSLQSTILLYENRADSLKEWTEEMKKVHKVK